VGVAWLQGARAVPPLFRSVSLVWQRPPYFAAARCAAWAGPQLCRLTARQLPASCGRRARRWETGALRWLSHTTGWQPTHPAYPPGGTSVWECRWGTLGGPRGASTRTPGSWAPAHSASGLLPLVGFVSNDAAAARRCRALGFRKGGAGRGRAGRFLSSQCHPAAWPGHGAFHGLRPCLRRGGLV
jgi:hypothetical protein